MRTIIGLNLILLVMSTVAYAETCAAGGALRFDGGATVKLFSNSVFRDRPYVTIQYWIKYDDPNNHGYVIDQFGPAPVYTGEWAIITRQGQAVYYFRWPGETSVGTNSDSITDGNWHQVTITKHNAVLDFYVDGQHDLHREFGSGHRLNSDVPFYIGSRGNFEQFIEGELDELRIWDRKLTGDEVEANWNRLVDPDSPGLIGYWRFDEPDGSQLVEDLTQFGSDGSLGETIDAGEDDPDRIPSTAPLLPEPPICPGDLTGDLLVGLDDLARVLASYGCTGTCSGDVDGDCDTDLTDLAELLARFGQTCP